MSSHLRSPQWMPFAVVASLVIALAAAGLATWSVLRPTDRQAASYTDRQVAEATTTVCAAHDLAYRAVALQTNTEAPPDPSGPLAAAANARLALVVASEDLHTEVDDASATPPSLRDAVRELATAYRSVASNYLAGVENDAPPITEAFQRAGAAATTIGTICKK